MAVRSATARAYLSLSLGMLKVFDVQHSWSVSAMSAQYLPMPDRVQFHLYYIDGALCNRIMKEEGVFSQPARPLDHMWHLEHIFIPPLCVRAWFFWMSLGYMAGPLPVDGIAVILRAIISLKLPFTFHLTWRRLLSHTTESLLTVNSCWLFNIKEMYNKLLLTMFSVVLSRAQPKVHWKSYTRAEPLHSSRHECHETRLGCTDIL